MAGNGVGKVYPHLCSVSILKSQKHHVNCVFLRYLGSFYDQMSGGDGESNSRKSMRSSSSSFTLNILQILSLRFSTIKII